MPKLSGSELESHHSFTIRPEDEHYSKCFGLESETKFHRAIHLHSMQTLLVERLGAVCVNVCMCAEMTCVFLWLLKPEIAMLTQYDMPRDLLVSS